MEDVITSNSLNKLLNKIVKNFNTLLQCPARFSGNREEEDVNHFIEYITYYKSFKGISDEQALQELSHLLEEPAFSWWSHRQNKFATWQEALTELQFKYSRQRSENTIFADLLKLTYNDYPTIDDFLNEKYDILNELPECRLSEGSKIAIIYGLLPNDMQKEKEFSAISSRDEFKEYLLRYKQTESDGNPLSKKIKLEVEAEVREVHVMSESVATDDLKQTRCIFCKRKRHLWYMCNMLSEENLAAMYEYFDATLLDKCKECVLKHRQKLNLSGFPKIHIRETLLAVPGSSTNADTEYTDIMEKINRIIDESESYCPNIENNLKITSVKAVEELPGVNINTQCMQTNDTPNLLITSVISSSGINVNENNLLNIPKDNSLPTTENMQSTPIHVDGCKTNSQNPAIQKKKIRCKFCRKCGHQWHTCFRIPIQLQSLITELESAECTDNGDIQTEKTECTSILQLIDGAQESQNELQNEIMLLSKIKEEPSVLIDSDEAGTK
ncbi:uncharacterized protein LOC142230646 isoform X2 [Haematobia irritans]|uniref:uncharacterized protein LOC142230646 isoform X2 n=1 Tax=Haematobia irritans TaxID=7368 RepID=UPI003F50C9D7